MQFDRQMRMKKERGETLAKAKRAAAAAGDTHTNRAAAAGMFKLMEQDVAAGEGLTNEQRLKAEAAARRRAKVLPPLPPIPPRPPLRTPLRHGVSLRADHGGNEPLMEMSRRRCSCTGSVLLLMSLRTQAEKKRAELEAVNAAAAEQVRCPHKVCPNSVRARLCPPPVPLQPPPRPSAARKDTLCTHHVAPCAPPPVPH